MTNVLAQIDTLDVAPNPNELPGGSLIGKALGWLGYIAVAAAVASLLIGGAFWALGSVGGNPQSAQRGRQLVVGGLIAALIAGAAFLLVDAVFKAADTATNGPAAAAPAAGG